MEEEELTATPVLAMEAEEPAIPVAIAVESLKPEPPVLTAIADEPIKPPPARVLVSGDLVKQAVPTPEISALPRRTKRRFD